MQILETLFPLKTVKRKDWMPVVNLVLQKNRSLIENIVGVDIEMVIQDKIVNDFAKLQEAKQKKIEYAQETLRMQIEHNIKKKKLKQWKYKKQFLYGLFSMILFLAF